MEKFAAPIVVLVSVFLYFTHDAGFNFEKAKPEKRIEFVQRQAHRAAKDGHFMARSDAGAIWVSSDQKQVRLKMHADAAMQVGKHRQAMIRRACQGYLNSYLDEHAITLRLEFYAESGAMAGSMSLSPSVCATFGERKA